MANMNLKTISIATLLFSACFVGMVLLLVHEQRPLSPRWFALTLAICCVGSSVAFVFGLFIYGRKRAAQSPEGRAGAALDPATLKQRMFFIRLWKVMIALLVLGLVSGLSKARDFPVWATGVGVALNLGLTASLVRAVLRLQRTLK